MPRVNSWLPQNVYDTLRRELPNVNVSKLLQLAIEGTLNCWHDQLECTRCGSRVDHQYLLSKEVTRFYEDVRHALTALVLTGRGTAEGAQRVLQDVAKLWHGKGLVHWDAANAPIERTSRSVREAVWQRDQGEPARHQFVEAAAAEQRALLRDEEIA